METSTASAEEDTPVKASRRLLPEEREQQIVKKAIEHFTRNGFGGSTRELARQIGVTQPLLYRYFQSKDALIERVYNEVFQWRPGWEGQIADRSLPLTERLHAFYLDYSSVILREEWIRLFIFAGLTHEGINKKYLSKLRSKVFLPVLAEVREEFGIPAPRNAAETEAEIEMIWSLHAAIFYIGVRKWIYGLKVPTDMDAVIRRQVDMFLNGAAAAIRAMRTGPPSAATSAV
ncbi:Transcriptional regulator, TetR family [Cupriavidus taiwanensis]|uniref:TetR/AcrR family transcriptional regulator n=1 Tax=Cupriavidus taiwanensis TaxID=164546 RepID=UPI000E1010A0|nr:TetR/AcrR family transcriptional regulator [Cupriavidus taiwanensis]SPA42896.1 Transcriptional regulator, TetR family [Cupriavidus taiwanensis]